MTAKYWDKRAEKYDDLVRKHDAVYQRTIASAKSLLSTSDVVLDLGCATGEYSLDIAPFVRRVHGIDTSANMIALATKKISDRSIGNATFAAADVFDRPLDGRGFTAVLAFSVLHLVGEIRPVLGRVNELLPKGGLFISQTPCLSESSFLFKLFIGVARKVKIVPPVLSLTALELEEAIAGAGFDFAESEVWDRKKAVHWIVARKR
jgi:ubiquinone/menaquinone biosynthesis C-methylase UbiE